MASHIPEYSIRLRSVLSGYGLHEFRMEDISIANFPFHEQAYGIMDCFSHTHFPDERVVLQIIMPFAITNEMCSQFIAKSVDAMAAMKFSEIQIFQCFLRDCYAFRLLGEHPNVDTGIVGFIEKYAPQLGPPRPASTTPALVYRFFPLDNLKDYVRHNRYMPTGIKFKLLHNVATGLDFIHGHSIVHRNINGCAINIKRSADGEHVACISDFAAAKIQCPDGSAYGPARPNMASRQSFCVPECSIDYERADLPSEEHEKALEEMEDSSFHNAIPASDIWAFGLLFLQVIEGYGVNESAPSAYIRMLDGRLSEEQLDFAKSCLEIDPAKRPTAKDAYEALSKFMEAESSDSSGSESQSSG
ncbi:kinase-like domain-containing protein [Phellopilus nigrolimitatus]|nr:kinase-like domain-containing protein [Phellopilus nigrolimitatus]